ncbi:protein SOB FIVE-LIKE 5-like isoform X1 [Typha latifolia]|uniref:protein SOB FIVE-LIKE 5-like isoform X1 n=1 Tax=Typha latifolia TaxID=4733 RepID=UPI003C2B9969
MMLGEGGGERSECSSGCQSGWTMYLDQSYEKGSSFQVEVEEEEEDLSMVSDASSGPPHFNEEEQYYCFRVSTPSDAAALSNRNNGGKKRRVESEQHKELSSLLDDTASSSFLSYSESINATTTNMRETMDNVVEFSCASSATHYKEKSTLQKQTGYLQSFNPRKQTAPRPVMSSIPNLFSPFFSFILCFFFI